MSCCSTKASLKNGTIRNGPLVRRQLQSGFQQRRLKLSLKPKVELDITANTYRDMVFSCGPKADLLRGINGFLRQSMRQAAYYTDISDPTVPTINNIQYDDSFYFFVSRFLRIFRLLLINYLRLER